MPEVTNEVYKRVLQTQEIELIKPKALNKWFDKIPSTKRPKKATETHCRILLTLLYYTGARPSELIDLTPKDIIKIELPKTEDSPKVRAYQITLKTLKKGKPLRNLLIPINKYTSFCYKNIKKQHPLQQYFYAFVSRKGGTKNKVTWTNKRKIYVRQNGQLIQEELKETKEKTYFKKGNKINKYITNLTGLPPYWFRHHRFSFMFDKGAPIKNIADFKGGKIENTTPYIGVTSGQKKKQLKYF